MKRLLSIMLIAVLAISFAACAAKPEPAKPTEPPAPTEPAKPTEPAEPTEPPAPTILPEPTEDPTPSNEWFKDEAWKLVAVINMLYGTSFEKDEGIVSHSQLAGSASIHWYREDSGADLHVEFVKNESGVWETGMNRVLFCFEPSMAGADEEKYENDLVQLSGLSLDLTANDLKKAGYEPDGGEGDLDMAAEYMANHVAGLFIGLPNGNYFKCSDGGIVRFVQYPTEWTTHVATIALMPVDYSNWGAAYGDIMGHLCADPDHYGYITIWMNINAVRNDDGSFSVSINWGM